MKWFELILCYASIIIFFMIDFYKSMMEKSVIRVKQYNPKTWGKCYSQF